MKQELIKTLVQEHEVIETLLNEFEREYKRDFTESRKILKTFMWNLEKHMLLEEKFLYSSPSLWNGNIEEIFEILSEHGDILFMTKKIKNSNFTEEDISSLKELLREHFTAEEIILYPKFEKELNEEQKILLLDRATEVLIA
jgi:hemerythrin-like domain-containing protein